MDEETEKRIESRLNFEIGIQKELMEERDKNIWTPDYCEGYLDGIKRAIELIPEFDSEE